MRKRTELFDGVTEEILEEVAAETGERIEVVRDCYDVDIQLIISGLRRGDPVLVPNFGYFYFSPYKITERIWRMIASMRNRESGKDPEGMTREQVIEKIKKYWPIHERARRQLLRTGKRYRAKRKREEILRARSHPEQL